MNYFKFNDKYSMIENEKLRALEPKVIEINEMFRNKKGQGAHMTGWADSETVIPESMIKDIENLAKYWQDEGIDTLVVCGIGGSYLGGRAINDLINLDNQKMDVMWFGYSFSGDYINRCLKKLAKPNCKFACVIISKSGTTLETIIGFRLLRDLLTKKHGKDKIYDYLAFVTDTNDGILHNYVKKHNARLFLFPPSIGGRFSVITPCGLLPLAILGADIREFLKGYRAASSYYKKLTGLNNDAYKYACLRYLLSMKYECEFLILYSDDAWYIAEWWKQLYAESEGKDLQGLIPNSSIFPFGLHSVGQYIQEGKKNFYETVLLAKHSRTQVKLPYDEENLDNLNYLSGANFDDIVDAVYKGVVEAHGPIGKNPNLIIEIDQFNAYNAGYLVHFSFLAVMMCCYLRQLNPFDQPGVEIYKKEVKAILESKYKK